MRTTLAGPEMAAQQGDVLDISDEQGKKLIDDGHADEVVEVEYETTEAFHGGLTMVQPSKIRESIPHRPDSTVPLALKATGVVQDRRTADELAADARLDAGGATGITGPLPVKSGAQREEEEIQAKTAGVSSAKVDPKASAHEALVSATAKPAPAAQTAPSDPRAEVKK